ncbi:hypothetical protein Hbl1158_14625 [Halobaculum sp. CBA1158]|uniref:hypothetical protein n=1 Tax=Halobaculum sp. CBA1158 TaxID=2904243 RepID=UPI001F45FB33|nr:hypothetical protein [Halobaculum sp. CBA1158]UIO99736.1 hypothetical protein Hbl1158_14625 [Halobaculum sp. CBA1158]
MVVDAGVVALAVTGGAFVAFALATLKPDSGLRRAYAVDPADDAAARGNAAVVAAVGAGLLALAGAVAAGVPGRVVGVATLSASAAACLALGWLVRYRDRRELLTIPNADRETARRLGAAVMGCGLLLLPLIPAVWLDAGDAVVAALALGTSLLALVAVAVAVR